MISDRVLPLAFEKCEPLMNPEVIKYVFFPWVQEFWWHLEVDPEKSDFSVHIKSLMCQFVGYKAYRKLRMRRGGKVT